MVINPIVGVYIPIIRIPIKGGMTIPNIATFDHGTYQVVIAGFLNHQQYRLITALRNVLAELARRGVCFFDASLSKRSRKMTDIVQEEVKCYLEILLNKTHTIHIYIDTIIYIYIFIHIHIEYTPRKLWWEHEDYIFPSWELSSSNQKLPMASYWIHMIHGQLGCPGQEVLGSKVIGSVG